MKAVKVIRNIIVGILIVIFFAFAIAMTVLLLNRNNYGLTQFDDITMVMVKQEMSSDKYKKGDIVLVKSQQLTSLGVGDEVFVYKIGQNKSVSIDVGVIGEIYDNDDAISFENGSTYDMEYVFGTADKVYSNVGNILSLVLSQWGFLLIILIPSLLIFIYELYAIVIEVKYGKQKDVKEA